MSPYFQDRNPISGTAGHRLTPAASLTVFPTPQALPRQARVRAVALPGTPLPNLTRWPLPLFHSTLWIPLPAPLERSSEAGQGAPCSASPGLPPQHSPEVVFTV